VSSISTDITQTFDIVRVAFRVLVDKDIAVGLRVNSDSGSNYSYRRVDGSYDSGDTGFYLNDYTYSSSQSDEYQSGIVELDGRWNQQVTVSSCRPMNAVSGSFTQNGKNPNVDSPLDSVTLYERTGSVMSDIEVEIWGYGL
jgi:hypothetical protein